DVGEARRGPSATAVLRTGATDPGVRRGPRPERSRPGGGDGAVGGGWPARPWNRRPGRSPGGDPGREGAAVAVRRRGEPVRVPRTGQPPPDRVGDGVGDGEPRTPAATTMITVSPG